MPELHVVVDCVFLSLVFITKCFTKNLLRHRLNCVNWMNQPKSTGGLTSDMVTGLLTKVILSEALVNELKVLFGTSGANWRE